MTQYEIILKQYGTRVNHGTARVYLTHDEMVHYFGERCDDYEPGCAVCKNWLSWDETGEVVFEFDRDKFLEFIDNM